MADEDVAPASVAPKPVRRVYMPRWMIVLLSVFGAFLALGILGEIINPPPDQAVRTTSPPTTKPPATKVTAPPTTATTTAPRPTYAGQQKGDQLADADGFATVSGYGTLGSQWAENRSERVVCGIVAVKNLTSSTKPYSFIQWSMQTPNGELVPASLLDSTLSSGSLVAGGATAGNICFSEPAVMKHGQFVFIFQPTGSSSRGIWLADLP